MTSPRIYAIVFLVIQLVPLYAQSEINCPPGQALVSQACKPCPAGTYRFINSTNECVKCPAGTFNPIRGAGSENLCQFCETNTFSGEGSTRCKKCPRGTVSDPRASRCRACGLGFVLNRGRCNPCPEASFNDKNASLTCESCPFPLTSPRQATSRSDCRPCPLGQFASTGGCQVCPEGTFHLGRGLICELCPPGYVSKPGSTSCKPCLSGTVARGTFKAKCAPCPEGTTSNGPGATRCRPIGSTSCPNNTFENANGDCQRCRNNFRYNKETQTCEPCPPGSFSKGGLRTECKTCPSGQRLEEGGSSTLDCRCPKEGTFSAGDKCKPCPRGTYGSFLTLPSKFGCIKCSMGTFSNKVGSTSCTPCPFGTFSDAEGAKRCKKCPRGFVPSRVVRDDELVGSTSCMAIATGCRPGFQPKLDVFGRIRCGRVTCVAGTQKKDIGIKCLPCKAGFILDGNKCKRCGIDEVSEGGMATSCTKCKNGLFRDEFLGSECTCRGFRGTGKGIQDGVCKDCPPGSFGDPNSEECAKCSTGTFSSVFGETNCTPCPRGTFADVEGLTACKTCPKGQVPERTTGSRQCVTVT